MSGKRCSWTRHIITSRTISTHKVTRYGHIAINLHILPIFSICVSTTNLSVFAFKESANRDRHKQSHVKGLENKRNGWSAARPGAAKCLRSSTSSCIHGLELAATLPQLLQEGTHCRVDVAQCSATTNVCEPCVPTGSRASARPNYSDCDEDLWHLDLVCRVLPCRHLRPIAATTHSRRELSPLCVCNASKNKNVEEKPP